MRHSLLIITATLCFATVSAQPQRRWRREAFTTDTMMVHDPVMARQDSTFYLFATGMGVQMATSKDLKTWTVQPQGALTQIPAWTHDSVPGFRSHVWAPDIIHYRGRWWLAYSCSTFGRNTSAIGLSSSPTLDFRDTVNYRWRDEGALICSRERRDNWNAIDPNFVIDTDGQPWLTYGSFWDGIQLVRLNAETMHVADGATPVTIARRVAMHDTLSAEPNPTSRHAGRNAIEAPFIFRHGEFYYLFVSHDYCCRGIDSNYKVVVGRSNKIEGPYLDDRGLDMAEGGGRLVIKGDRNDYEAAGHCAVYHIDDAQPYDLFICHGYNIRLNGQAILIKRKIEWDKDGWPTLKEKK